MLISKKMNDALNVQIGHEFGASLQYVEIAAYFASEGFNVLAGIFFKQSGEEREHALRLVKYILDMDGEVHVPAIPAPKSHYKSAVEAVQAALNWEKEVTGQINGLVDQAFKENDHLTRNMLNWFLTEQVEEVSTMDNLLKLVRRAGANLINLESTVEREMNVGNRTAQEKV